MSNIPSLAIAATFTAEPLGDSLSFWMQKLALPLHVEFAPYSQIFQELLDPASLLARNEEGVNLVLLRFEDLMGGHASSSPRARQTSGLAPESLEPTEAAARQLEQTVLKLILALKGAAARSSVPHLLCICPSSPLTLAARPTALLYQRMEALLRAQLDAVGSIHLLTGSQWAPYPVTTYYDARADQLGHIPFTSAFFASLGTAISRRILALKSPPYKVIVLGCDQTLWKGVCAEDGTFGIEIDGPRKALQEFMVEQHAAGMLICLCSKNAEADVIDVFEQRTDMPLRHEYIVSWRINWNSKSQNIQSLAHELQLGLDSFVFVDDDPVECAEVMSACPEVLTLRLPRESEDIPQFLHHIWAFDHQPSSTSVDSSSSKTDEESGLFTEIASELREVGSILRAMESCRSRARPAFASPFVGPRNGDERVLAEIWSRVLGVSPVGIYDDFADLGGDSLLAVLLLVEVERVAGRQLSSVALFHAPTIDKLAGILSDEGWSPQWASLVPIQPNGSRPPLFFLSGVRNHFGQRLGPDQPMYRLQIQDPDREEPFTRVADMAAHCIKDLRALQPEGPYFLGGHCLGGLVAFEIAQQLQAIGQRVGLLVLCDTYAPGSRYDLPDKSRMYRLWQRARFHANRFSEIGVKAELTHLLNAIRKTSQQALWRRSWKIAADAHALRDIKAANYKAECDYSPKPYAGHITIFQAERAPWKYHDPQMGWGGIASEGVKIHELPTRHTGMYSEPHVSVLVEKLGDCLLRAQVDT